MNVCGGGVFIILGLGGVWIGVLAIQNSRSTAPLIIHGQPHPRMRRPEGRTLFILLSVIGLGFVGFGVMVMRHAQGPYVEVPASAPLVDHVIWILTNVCLLGGICALAAWALTEPARERRSRQRGTEPTDG